jgi:hypothetical protein
MDQLTQRIHDEIQRIPAIDVHSHLGAQGLRKARTLADIVSYHWIMLELRRAGADVEPVSMVEDGEAYMHKVAPYFGAVRTTSNHFTLMGMLRELYGFEQRTITPDNWRDLDEKVRKKAEDTNRLTDVLDKANIAALPIATPSDGVPQGFDRYFAYAFGENLFAGSTVKRLQALAGNTEEMTGTDYGKLKTLDALQRCIEDHVRVLTDTHNVKALHIWIRDSWYFEPCHEVNARAYLDRIWRSQPLTEQENRQLTSFTAGLVADAAARYGVTLQLFHGMDFYMGGNLAGVNSYCNLEFMRALPAFASMYPDTNIDVFLATRIVSHEAASIARSNNNLSISGAWWHAFTPSTLCQFFKDRLELLPHTSWNAFFSDGYIIEWVYAKSLLTRNRLARALADHVNDGFMHEDDVPEVARAVLHDNARHIYHLT